MCSLVRQSGGMTGTNRACIRANESNDASIKVVLSRPHQAMLDRLASSPTR
jgi:hypothetical protein